MYDRDLLLPELIGYERKIKAMLRAMEANGDAQKAKAFYQRLGTLTGVAQKVWRQCEQSQFYGQSPSITTILRTEL